jgi:hypothetical protein
LAHQAVLDEGFASKANWAAAKERQIKDVCFAKQRGLKVEQSYPGSDKSSMERT